MREYDINLIKATVDKDELINVVQANFSPEEVYGESELEQWATDNGFIKEDDLLRGAHGH